MNVKSSIVEISNVRFGFARKNQRLMAEVEATNSDPFQVISAALDSGLELNEAIKQLGGNK